MCNFNSVLHHEARGEAAAQMVAEPGRPPVPAIACFGALAAFECVFRAAC